MLSQRVERPDTFIDGPRDVLQTRQAGQFLLDLTDGGRGPFRIFPRLARRVPEAFFVGRQRGGHVAHRGQTCIRLEGRFAGLLQLRQSLAHVRAQCVEGLHLRGQCVERGAGFQGLCRQVLRNLALLLRVRLSGLAGGPCGRLHAFNL